MLHVIRCCHTHHSIFSILYVDPPASTYNCAAGSTQASVPTSALCDGVNDCGNTPSSDEVNALCDSKLVESDHLRSPSKAHAA